MIASTIHPVNVAGGALYGPAAVERPPVETVAVRARRFAVIADAALERIVVFNPPKGGRPASVARLSNEAARRHVAAGDVEFV